MKRWFALFSCLAGIPAVATAQPPAKTVTGVMIIRVKVNSPGNSVAATPGGGGELVAGILPAEPPPGDMRSVVAVVPFKNLYQAVVYTNKPLIPQTNPSVFWLSHDSGKALLFTDASRIQLTPQYDLNTDVILKTKHAAWATKRSAEGLFDLISLALGYDHVETALEYCKELEKLLSAKKEGTAPKRIADFIVAYKQLMSKFDETLPVASDTAEWKKRLQAADTAEDKHYSIIHFGDQSIQRDGVNARLAELERNYKAFFLWHAVMGQKLPTPEKKQIVILAKRAADIPALRAQLDGTPVVSDGTYLQYPNVVVLSPERLDDTGRSFLEMMKAEYDTGWSRESLLKGVPPKVTDKTTFGDIFRMSTNALVENTMEKEATRSAITRECNRQLFVSSGVVPQYVLLPKWLDQGLANLLCVPKNPGVIPGVTPDKPLMLCGYGSGYGTPNYLMFREWKQLKIRQEIPTGKPEALQSDANMSNAAKALLLAVLNDTYFEAVRTGIDPDANAETAMIPGGMQPGAGIPPPPGGPGFPPTPPERGPVPPPLGGIQQPTGNAENPGIVPPLIVKLEHKAQATAWALTYFLSRERPAGMKKYCAELNAMPRDMRIGKKQSIETFAKCFNLMNPDETAIDDVKLKDFARKWIGYLDATQESWRDIPVETTTTVPPPPPNGVPPGPGMIPGQIPRGPG